MDTGTVSKIILLALGIILVGVLIDQAAFYNDANKATAINETFSPGVNNTCFGLDRGPVTTIDHVYSEECEYGSDRFAVCAGTGMKVYTNGTGACPTMNLTGGAKMVSYTVYKPTGISAVVIGLMVAVFLVALLLIYLGFV